MLRSSVRISDVATSKPLLTEVDNWRFAHPEKTNVVIINTFVARYQYGSDPDLQSYRAIIAEDRRQGNKVFLRTARCGALEAALRVLMEMTGSEVEDVLKRKIVEHSDSETLV